GDNLSPSSKKKKTFLTFTVLKYLTFFSNTCYCSGGNFFTFCVTRVVYTAPCRR
ncbi:hypothetical protein C0J52_22645, partial [Blattella germanica]